MSSDLKKLKIAMAALEVLSEEVKAYCQSPTDERRKYLMERVLIIQKAMGVKNETSSTAAL
jgi:hypothetical protein